MTLIPIDELGTVFLRVGTGGALAYFHGWHKIADGFRWRTGHATSWPFADEIRSVGFPVPTASAWFATLVQLLGGIGLVFGLQTRFCSVGILCTLSGAVYTNIRNKKSLQLVAVYVLLVGSVLLLGSGPWSFDSMPIR